MADEMPTMHYRGTIIEESLTDSRLLNGLEIVGVKITKKADPSERWHLYSVRVTEEEIAKLAEGINDKKWYTHFWDEAGNIIVAFKDKRFDLKQGDDEDRKQAIA